MTRVPDHPWTKAEAQRWRALIGVPGAAELLQHFCERVCGSHQVPFHPDNPALGNFDAGKQWVARQIANALTWPDSELSEESNERADYRPDTITERARVAAERVHGLGTNRR